MAQKKASKSAKKTTKSVSKSTTKKSVAKKTSAKNDVALANLRLFAGSSFLFVGVLIIVVGYWQSENVGSLLAGFGAALLVFGGVLVSLSIRRGKAKNKR